MRAVLDPNVLIAAVLSPGGAPAQLVARGLAGEFELIVSEQLLAELARALDYPRLRRRIPAADGEQLVNGLRRLGRMAPDPATPPPRSRDPGDDYLLALAEGEQARLISGDRHLLELAPGLPIHTARQFLELLDPRAEP